MRTSRLDLEEPYADFQKQTYYISLMNKSYTNGYATEMRNDFGGQSQGSMGYKIMILKIV